MELLRNSSGDYELLEALQIREKERRIANTSSLTARLNPDFDPRAVAKEMTRSANNQLNAIKIQANHHKSLCSAPTPVTLASNLRDMSLADRQEISASFKTSILNTTLKFIKDPTQLILPYPEMSLHEAQFLYNLIERSEETNGNLGLGFKSMYSSLHETINKFKEKYEFQVSITSSSQFLTRKLVLKKILKKKQVDVRKNAGVGDISNDLNSTISSSVSSERSTNLIKAQREMSSKESIVKMLPETFLRSALERFYDFIEDDFSASLEFKKVNVAESRFFECLTRAMTSSYTSPRSEEFYRHFSPECAVLLKRSRRALRKHDWTLRIDVDKLSRHTETRSITFHKTPCYGSQKEIGYATIDKPSKQLCKATKFAMAFGIPVVNSSETDENVVTNTPKDENDRSSHKALNMEEPKLAQSYIEDSRLAQSKTKDLTPVEFNDEPLWPEIKALRPVKSNNNQSRPALCEIKALRPVRAGNKDSSPAPSEIKELRPVGSGNIESTQSEIKALRPVRAGNKESSPAPSEIKELRPVGSGNKESTQSEIKALRPVRAGNKDSSPAPSEIKELRPVGSGNKESTQSEIKALRPVRAGNKDSSPAPSEIKELRPVGSGNKESTQSEIKALRPVRAGNKDSSPAPSEIKELRPVGSGNKESTQSEIKALRPVRAGNKDSSPAPSEIKELRPVGSGNEESTQSEIKALRPVRAGNKDSSPAPSEIKELRPVGSGNEESRSTPSKIKELRSVGSNNKELTPSQSQVKELRPVGSTNKESRPAPSEIKKTVGSGNIESRPTQSEIKGLRPSKTETEECRPNNREKSADSNKQGDCRKKLTSDNENQRSRQLAAVSFQSAAAFAEGAVGGKCAGSDGVLPPRVTPSPTSCKGRLLRGLATPVEAGLAEKMMRNMGWKGGALGARGDGIVEPIRPAIHLTPGAGLGHIKQRRSDSALRDIRIKLLRGVLSLLLSSSTELTVSFAQPVLKQHCRFLKPAIDAFNNRRKFSLSGPEVEVVGRISEEMLRDQRLKVEFKVTRDWKEFHLRKTDLRASTMQTNNTKSTSNDVTYNDVMTILDTKSSDVNNKRLSRKAAERLAYKLKFLEKIKEFLNSDNEEAEYKFGCSFNKKRRQYLRVIVEEINGRKMITRNSDQEAEVLRGIREVVGDWSLTIKFNDKSFQLSKKILKPQAPSFRQLTVIYDHDVPACLPTLPTKKCNELNSSVTKDDNITDDDCKYTANANIVDCGMDRETDQDNITNRDGNVITASELKGSLVSCSKLTPDDKDTSLVNEDLGYKLESSIVSVPDITNDVVKYGCDTNNNVNDESACDDDNKFILPDSDDSFSATNATCESDKDIESNLESSFLSNDVSISKNRHYDNVNDYGSYNSNDKNNKKKHSSFVDEEAALDNKLTLPYTDDAVDNDTDQNLETDFGSSNAINANISLDDSVMTDISVGQCNDNFNTSLSDTEYDNLLSYHSELNINHNSAKDKNLTDQDTKQNTEPLPNSSSSKRNSSLTDKRSPKKYKFVKYVRIYSKNRKEIGKESVKFIQNLILDEVDENVFLPLVKCRGIKDGGLMYSCHNKDSYDWLKIVLNIVSDVLIIDTDFSENGET